MALDLVVTSLNSDLEHREESKPVPAFSEATTALKQLICCAPPEFSNSLASTILESKSLTIIYPTLIKRSDADIHINDRCMETVYNPRAIRIDRRQGNLV